MKHTKHNDHILFENKNGSYHMTIDLYNSMSHEEAEEYAKAEIQKKVDAGTYTKTTINFKDARKLGFCKYGIEDFCGMAKIDIEKTYKVSDLLSKLTYKMVETYPSELYTLFGDDIVTPFGGADQMLKDYPTKETTLLVLKIKDGKMTDYKLHCFACDNAEHSLPFFETVYPDDDRPRKAIEAKRQWIKEKYGKVESMLPTLLKQEGFDSYEAWHNHVANLNK